MNNEIALTQEANQLAHSILEYLKDAVERDTIITPEETCNVLLNACIFIFMKFMGHQCAAHKCANYKETLMVMTQAFQDDLAKTAQKTCNDKTSAPADDELAMFMKASLAKFDIWNKTS